MEDPIVNGGDEPNWSDSDSLEGNDAEGLAYILCHKFPCLSRAILVKEAWQEKIFETIQKEGNVRPHTWVHADFTCRCVFPGECMVVDLPNDDFVKECSHGTEFYHHNFIKQI